MNTNFTGNQSWNKSIHFQGAAPRAFWWPVYRFGHLKMFTKNLMSQKKYKSVIVLKIYFRESDAFQQLLKRSKIFLKLPHCIWKTTLARPHKREDPQFLYFFVAPKFHKLCNCVNCCPCNLKHREHWADLLEYRQRFQLVFD